MIIGLCSSFCRRACDVPVPSDWILDFWLAGAVLSVCVPSKDGRSMNSEECSEMRSGERRRLLKIPQPICTNNLSFFAIFLRARSAHSFPQSSHWAQCRSLACVRRPATIHCCRLLQKMFSRLPIVVKGRGQVDKEARTISQKLGKLVPSENEDEDPLFYLGDPDVSVRSLSTSGRATAVVV